MREWMIALGILVVVAVALDCVRRIRSASKDSLHLATNMKRGLADRVDPLDEDRDVLGVRVSPRSQLEEDDDPLFGTATSRPELSDTGRRLDLDQAVPLLVDVNDTQRIEPAFDEDEGDAAVTQPVPVMDEDFGLDQSIGIRAVPDDELEDLDAPASAPLAPARPVTAGPLHDPATTPLSAGESEIVSPPRVYERPANRPPPRREQPVIKESKPVIKAREERARKLQQQAEEQQSRPQQLQLEDYVLINVMARDRSRFSGAALLEAMMACGLRYGHHNVFHHYLGEDREEESLFSVVNVLKPGTFDLNRMEDFNTPGIGLILRLPVPMRSLDAFEIMLHTARQLAERLQGELRDEHRNGMTAQTIEHYRQRVRDFEMQLQLHAR